MRRKQPHILYQLLLQRLTYFTSTDALLESEWVPKLVKEHMNQGSKEREGKLQEMGYVRRLLRNKTRIWTGVRKCKQQGENDSKITLINAVKGQQSIAHAQPTTRKP